MQLCPATVLKCQEAIPISNNEMRKIHRGGEEQPARPMGRKVNVSQSRREVHSAAENRTRTPKAPKSPKPPKEKSKHPILRFIGRTVATVLCLGIMLGSVVAVGMVSNVLGLRAPVEAIVARAHAVGAVVVLDCAQSAPHMPVDVKKLDVDFAACSAHKLYAPMGMGALYARAELLDKMPPFLSGGDMIGAVHEHSATWAEGPRKFEAGTRNVGGEVGFAAALDYMDAIGWDAMMAHEHTLLDRMLKGMAQMPWLTVYGDPTAANRFGVVSFNVNDVHPHDVATILDAGGVAVRAGHHCAQPLMDFLGIGSCCRASVAVYNTKADVDALLENLENVRKVMGL